MCESEIFPEKYDHQFETLKRVHKVENYGC